MLDFTAGFCRLENLPDARSLLRVGRAMVELYCESFRQIPRRIRHGEQLNCKAGADHEQTKPDDIGERVGNQVGRAWVHHAGGQPIRDAKTLLNLAQHQNADVRRQKSTVEFGDNSLATDR